MSGLFSTLGSYFGPWGTAIGSVVDYAVESDDAENARRQQGLINDQNYQAQKEFAQKGIQWKADDARAAGLHPLAVLGGSGASFSPSFQFHDSTRTSSFNPASTGLVEMGQNTARAERAGLSDYEREIQALAVRRGQLENALLEGQITQLWSSVMGQPGNPPAPGPSFSRPVSSSGQANTGAVKVVPSESEATRKNDAGLAAGSSPLFRDQKVSNETTWELLSPEVGEAFEAYGEVLKPIMSIGAHLQRNWDRTQRDFKGKRLWDKPRLRSRSGGASSSW